MFSVFKKYNITKFSALRSLLSLATIELDYLVHYIKIFYTFLYTPMFLYSSVGVSIFYLCCLLIYLLLYSSKLRISSKFVCFKQSHDSTNLLNIKKIKIFNTIFFIMLSCILLYVLHLKISVNLNESKSLYSFFIFDFYSNFVGHLLLIFFLISLKLAERYVINAKSLITLEYPILLCFSTTFLLLLIAACDLMSLYLTLEGLSLTLYVLAAYDTASSGSIEASLKYFCLGAIASGLLGFGISLLYGSIGTLNYIKILYFFSSVNINVTSDYIISLSLSFISFGFFFKLSIPPFHTWTPDVYEGSPTITTFFFSTIVKFGVFCTFIRLIFTFTYVLFENHNSIKIFFICFSAAAISVGSIGALFQNKFKRFLGYTAINQMGFILLGVSCLSFYGFAAAMIHLIAYVLTNTIMFWILMSSTYANRKLIYFSDLRCLTFKNPSISIIFCLTLFSMAGIPPTLGFYTKFLLLKAAMFAGFFLPVVFVLFFNVLSIFYYIRLIKILVVTQKSTLKLSRHTNFFLVTTAKSLEQIHTIKCSIFSRDLKLTAFIFNYYWKDLKSLVMTISTFILLTALGLKTYLKSASYIYILSSLWDCFKILGSNQSSQMHEIFKNDITVFSSLF